MGLKTCVNIVLRYKGFLKIYSLRTGITFCSINVCKIRNENPITAIILNKKEVMAQQRPTKNGRRA
jgi:hypothetical protein